ncbi:MAG: UDP-3-O-(3-hydroxymyristoyl)glucosamine N-acyltransferase [Alphaproteobacteria bacterium 64-6]|nr:MAG: UDP-3-O-(3-hydroxymyristoyl)glucosamine N-acyltransferase [Alphaproteobacteria bacterium 64-6]
MEHPGFFERAGPFTAAELAERIGATLRPGDDGACALSGLRPLGEAGPAHLTFVDNRKYLEQLTTTRAAACIMAPAFADRLPAGVVALLMAAPYRGFALALQAFYPTSLKPKTAGCDAREEGGSAIHPTARIEPGAIIEPGAVVGREAWIGTGTTVAAGALIGYRVTVGRDCFIGPGVALTHALVGDRVILHAGVRIGQDGFGFAMGAGGHLKVPQIGRVIIQDDVEIGANSCVDRGALKDTVIGEGTKIDNLVQIGHNVVIGRRCVIVAQTGLAGSSVLEDFVVMGGQSGVAGHLKVGAGAQIAGASHVTENVPPRARMIGTPALPIREWTRERVVLRRLARGRAADAAPEGGEDA